MFGVEEPYEQADNAYWMNALFHPHSWLDAFRQSMPGGSYSSMSSNSMPPPLQPGGTPGSNMGYDPTAPTNTGARKSNGQLVNPNDQRIMSNDQWVMQMQKRAQQQLQQAQAAYNADPVKGYSAYETALNNVNHWNGQNSASVSQNQDVGKPVWNQPTPVIPLSGPSAGGGDGGDSGGDTGGAWSENGTWGQGPQPTIASTPSAQVTQPTTPQSSQPTSQAGQQAAQGTLTHNGGPSSSSSPSSLTPEQLAALMNNTSGPGFNPGAYSPKSTTEPDYLSQFKIQQPLTQQEQNAAQYGLTPSDLAGLKQSGGLATNNPMTASPYNPLNDATGNPVADSGQTRFQSLGRFPPGGMGYDYSLPDGTQTPDTPKTANPAAWEQWNRQMDDIQYQYDTRRAQQGLPPLSQSLGDNNQLLAGANTGKFWQPQQLGQPGSMFQGILQGQLDAGYGYQSPYQSPLDSWSQYGAQSQNDNWNNLGDVTTWGA